MGAAGSTLARLRCGATGECASRGTIHSSHTREKKKDSPELSAPSLLTSTSVASPPAAHRAHEHHHGEGVRASLAPSAELSVPTVSSLPALRTELLSPGAVTSASRTPPPLPLPSLPPKTLQRDSLTQSGQLSSSATQSATTVSSAAVDSTPLHESQLILAVERFKAAVNASGQQSPDSDGDAALRAALQLTTGDRARLIAWLQGAPVADDLDSRQHVAAAATAAAATKAVTSAPALDSRRSHCRVWSEDTGDVGGAADVIIVPTSAPTAAALLFPAEALTASTSSHCPSDRDDFDRPLQLVSLGGLSVSSLHNTVDLSSISQKLQRAFDDVGAHANNICILLESWDAITTAHLDAFTADLAELFVAEHLEYAEMFDTSSPLEQARVTLALLGKAVLASSDTEGMVDTLLEIGAAHRRFNVAADHFDVVHTAFMSILPRYVPVERRHICATVWEPFWSLIVRLMKQGLTSERGDWHAAQRQAEWMAEVQSIMSLIEGLQQTPMYRGTFIPDMLDRAEAADPAMARYCLMREHRTAVRSFEALVFIATGVRDEVERERYVEQLAHEHMMYGVTEWGLRGLRQPFIDACAHFVSCSSRPEAWTRRTARSMSLYYDLLSRYWINGINSSRQALLSVKTMRAPDGAEPFCMMVTSIEANVQLWERNPTLMASAMGAHNRIVRGLIIDNGAYEVKTVGDSFVIAAKNVLIALKIALAIQLELMRGPIAPGFEMVSDVQGSGPAECWRNDSLRVRVGIHYCRDASAVYDSLQRRYDYYGPSVNCTARTESACSGGQILMTRDAVRALQPQAHVSHGSSQMLLSFTSGDINPAAFLEDLVQFEWWGEQRLSGIGEPVGLFSVLPAKLRRRNFPFFMGSRKVRVRTAEDDREAGRRTYCLSLSQLKSGALSEAESSMFRL